MSVIVIASHTGALLLMLVLPLALGIKVGLAALIAWSLWWQYRHGLRMSVCEISLNEDGSCIRTANGEQRRYRIVRATAHAGFLRLVMERVGERASTHLLPRDAIKPEVYRNLLARIAQKRLPVPNQTVA